MLDLFLNELVIQVVGVIVAAAIVFISFGLNHIKKLLNNYLGFDLAEIEIYHVARRALKKMNTHEDAVEYVLNTIQERLKKKGIKLEEDELRDIIENTLDELQEEDHE